MPDTNNLRLYTRLSCMKRPKSYKGKIMLIAFLGTHIPLLALFFYFVCSASLTLGIALRVMLTALFATLAGTGATLLALNALLRPISLASAALQSYRNDGMMPTLPMEFTDDAGTLMADTSHTLHKLDEVIHYINHYDGLTRLPNRTLLGDLLQGAVSSATRNHESLAVYFLHVDGLKTVNDTLGLPVGNLLLRGIADRLGDFLKPSDILARVEGSEFALVKAGSLTAQEIQEFAQNVISSFAKPFHCEGHGIHVNVCVGVSLLGSDASSSPQLLQNAGAALEQSRRRGKNTCQFYSAEINERLRERMTLENDLRGAEERGELLLHYQPRIDLASGQIKGVEALIRWQHPTRGMISPADFIPLAEETGLILPIGEWVLRTACYQYRAWKREGGGPLQMSVNLSARQFLQTDLVERIASILDETGMDPTVLELEMTESLLMEDVNATIPVLQKLRALGVSLALDDFGTGYSSMSYLRRFPINTLKIDRSFVRDLSDNVDDAAIVSAIISLARSLQLGIVAEGVEEAAQEDYLKSQGCDEVQGFYYSKPVPPNEISAKYGAKSELNSSNHRHLLRV